MTERGATIRAVALIPARAGSTRVPNKNIRVLGGHPLLAYTIASALASRVFATVIVSTDSEEYARIARHYGAEVPFLRAGNLAGELSPDIEWVDDALTRLRDAGRTFESFGILRPTSPFRQAATIQRAWRQFAGSPGVDSLRAVEKCKQHPGKMWVVRGERMTPLMPLWPTSQPWHSSQYQALPEVYVQNGSLELAWSRVVFEQGTIAGNVLTPFLTEGHEGFDINRPEDWERAESLIRAGAASLPEVDRPPYAARRAG